MGPGVLIDQRCIMRCILSSLERAGSSASEKERLQEIQVLEMERRSVQMRTGLSKQFILFGFQLNNIEAHRFCCDIHVDQILSLHPSQVPADCGSCAADDFADASVGQP